MRIYLCGLAEMMPQNNLDLPQSDTRFQQMSCKTMPQCM